jgi:hypothetical protein
LKLDDIEGFKSVIQVQLAEMIESSMNNNQDDINQHSSSSDSGK